MSGSNANELFCFEPGEPDDPVFFREFLSTFNQVRKFNGKPAPAEKADQHAWSVPDYRLLRRIRHWTQHPKFPGISTPRCRTAPAVMRCQQDPAVGVWTTTWQFCMECHASNDLLISTTHGNAMCGKESTQSTKHAAISINTNYHPRKICKRTIQ
jgi:hypothetical protein